MTNIDSIIEDDVKKYVYKTVHTGIISVTASPGQEVEPGDVLYTITRLGLLKEIRTSVPGTVEDIRDVGRRDPGLGKKVMDELEKIDQPVHMQVLISPT